LAFAFEFFKSKNVKAAKLRGRRARIVRFNRRQRKDFFRNALLIFDKNSQGILLGPPSLSFPGLRLTFAA